MASMALGLIGGYFFGPVGYLVGSFLGGLLDPPKSEGPRLSNLQLQKSNYGEMLPLHYGSNRLAGNIIWQTDLVEHKHKSGGKGGPQVTTYTYTASFAIALCEGPIANVSRIWADKRLIYDVNGLGTIPCTVYLGTTTQTADPTMETDLGAGNVPGFRETAYVVFADYDLSQFYNRIPSLEFEVNTKSSTPGPIQGVWLTIDNAVGHSQTQPVVTQWVLHAAPRVITALASQNSATKIPSAVVTYAADPTLAWVGAGTVGAADFWPQDIDSYVADPLNPGFAIDLRYHPIGLLTDSDGNVHAYWQNDLGGPGSPRIAGEDLDVSSYPAFGTDYWTIWGLPAAEEYEFAISQANNQALFIFSGVAGSGYASKWYKIVNGAIETQGTVTPTIAAIGWIGGQQSSGNRYSRGAGAPNSACFENNGLWCWYYNGGGNATGHSGGTISVYNIDAAGNFAYNSTCGNVQADVLQPGSTTITGMPNASIISTADGYAGLSEGNAMAIYRRTVPGSEDVLLSTIVSDLSVRAGLTTGQIDVTQLTDIVPGYTVTTQATARNDIQPLRNVYFFDGVESDGVIKFPKRTGAVAATIPQSDMAAFEGGGSPPPVLLSERTQEVDLPMQISVQYLNVGADYQIGTQYAQRQVTSSQSKTTLQLSIVIDDLTAKSVADVNLATAWAEREKHTFYTSRQYAYLEPTDVVIANGIEMRLITREETSTTTIKWEALGTVQQVYNSGASAAAAAPSAGYVAPLAPSQPGNASNTSLLLMDLPLVTDADASVADGFYAAMAPSAVISTTWPGGILEKSLDGGASYSAVLSDATPYAFGSTTSALGNWYGGNIFDEINSVTVTVGTGETLSGASSTAVLNGANMGAVGAELIQYKNATLASGTTYTLSGLLRGRRGTEWAMGGHAIGEKFCALPVDRVALSAAELNLLRQYKGITSGASLTSATAQSFANLGAPIRPYSPVLLGGGIDASGNVTLNWARRTRVGGAWQPYSDVPLSESSESYAVQIWDSAYSKCARIIMATLPTASYTSAQQVTDFGAQQKNVFFTVAQLGAIIGAQARGTAPGAGGSNGSVLAPISPYASPTSGSGSAPPAANVLLLTAGWPGAGGYTRVNSTRAGAFACGSILVVKFTTGGVAVNGAIGRLSGAEWSPTGPVRRVACLSTVQGDFAGTVFPNSLVENTSPTIWFSVGTNAYGYPALAINTTYYLNIKNDDGNGVCTCVTSDCGMYMDIYKPPGT